MNRESCSRLRKRGSPGRWSLLLLAGVSLVLPSCTADGHIMDFLGYSFAGNFDRSYKTIRVPTFQNRTYYRGLEFQLTQMVVTQIERMSPYKVVDGDADLELRGRILTVMKNVMLENPDNAQRVVDVVITVEVNLKDLRTGKIISKPPKRPGGPAVLEQVPPWEEDPEVKPGGNVAGVPQLQIQSPPVIPGNQQAVMNDSVNPPPDDQVPILPPSTPPPGLARAPIFPPGIIIRNTGNYIPELGQSITTAEQKALNNIAVQIVNMMEKPW